MAALAAAVRPFAGSVLPRRAMPAPSDASSERASGKKLPRVFVAPTRATPDCLAGVEELYVPSQKRKMMTCNRNNVETAATAVVGGEMSARELLQKRLASEVDVLRGLLKKAELISRRGTCNGGGAPTAGKKERFLASNSEQRSAPIVDGGGNAPSVMKRRKISALVVEHEQKQVWAPPWMSAEERNQLACRMSSLSGEVPGHIVEFLLNHVGDADADGEMEIDIDSVEDSVLFELKIQLDKFAPERPVVVGVLPGEKDDEKLAEKSKSKGILVKQEEEDVHISGVSTIAQTGSKPSSRSSSGSDKSSCYSARERYSDGLPARREALPGQIIATSTQRPSEPAPGATAPSGEAKKVQDVQRAGAVPKTVPLAGLIYRAKVRRELMEMEKAVLPDERVQTRDLQRLGIGEYGHPSLMRQLGLFLKADDA